MKICAPCLEQLPWNTRACPQCALPVEQVGFLCGGCLADPPPFSYSFVPFRYESPVSQFITQFKFHNHLRSGRLLSELLQSFVEIHYSDKTLPEYLIPVPLHSQRLRQRGFNQALEIARPLSKYFQIPLLYEVCSRQKNTEQQSRLSAAKRKRNIAGAFQLQDSFSAKHIALVDDVITTGQTVRTLSRLFKHTGVEKIDIWACARAV